MAKGQSVPLATSAETIAKQHGVDARTVKRDEHFARRKEIYEALHPETRPVTITGGPGRGHKTSETISPVSPRPAFAADTAAKTGVSRSTVEQEVKIAKAIPAPSRTQNGTVSPSTVPLTTQLIVVPNRCSTAAPAAPPDAGVSAEPSDWPGEPAAPGPPPLPPLL